MKRLFRRIKNSKPIRFVKNVWYFRRELVDFQWWDYAFTLNMLSRSIKNMSDNIEKRGIEIDKPRLKKVDKMRRVITIIENMKGVKHIELAEAELGELKEVKYLFNMTNDDLYEVIKDGESADLLHNDRVYERAREIEESEWNELWDIMRGQDYQEYKKLSKKNKDLDWNDWFDGTGMNGWWD